MDIPELGAISDMLLNSTAPTDIQENMSECERVRVSFILGITLN